MTATPIPRTMAMALFSDLEVSTIQTKPLGRLPIRTHIVEEKRRPDSHEWVFGQINEGAQVFWVCPLIEESETSEVKSAKKTFEYLTTEIFPKVSIGLLHGQMKPDQKEEVMRQFKSGEIKILVSTSVIEVGIDVPEATIMIIEGAEKFGLAQLHQIRGRVGRNDKQSWCFLFPSEDLKDKAKERLEFFASTTDGLQIAEYDMQSRGPGEVYGTKQSGIPDLKIASFTNIELIKQSQQIAKDLYKQGTKRIHLFNTGRSVE